MGWLFDSPEEKMEKALFNLKFASKSLLRESKKCEKEEKADKNKVKLAIQKNNTEGARIHAENSIRNHNQALNYLRMSARIDAVSSRVNTAMQTQRVTKNMVNVCRAMEGAMASMNLEKISEMMDRFEQQFENLDVQTNMMESTMQGTTTQFVPENDVNALMQEQADEAGIELNLALPHAGDKTLQTTAVSQEQDDLSNRLAKLRED
jgi:charged multivesicular body protein 1